MTKDEIRAVLGVAMSYDNRRMPGEANLTAWLEQANRHGWTLRTASEAVHQHYGSTNEFLAPAHVTSILREVRRRIREQVPADVCPPRELRDDPVAEIAWRRTWLDGFVSRALEAWARGEPLPPVERPVLEAPERPALAAAVRQLASGMTVPQPHRSSRAVRPRVRDGARLAEARAEIERLHQAGSSALPVSAVSDPPCAPNPTRGVRR